MSATHPAASAAPRAVIAATRSSKTVYLFALWGLATALVGLHSWGSWLQSPDFRPAPMGPDPLPEHVWWTLRTVEAVAVTLAVLLVGKFMVRPWRREGHVTWDGLFMISGFLLWWTDPIDNYFNFTFMYNSGFFNMASWASHIPGWEAPNQQNFPEPLFFVGGLYIWWFIAPVAMGCWGLNKLKATYPDASTMTRLLVLFGAFAVFDFVIENIFQRLEVFAYVGAYAPWTLWAGTPHQYPLYNSFIMALFFMGMTSLRYFRDDRGQSFAERGLDQVRASRAARTVLRQFALLGFLSLNILVTYYMPYCLLSLKADSFPKYPSYLLAEICGRRTAYACPSAEVPIPRRQSVAVPPDHPKLSADATRN